MPVYCLPLGLGCVYLGLDVGCPINQQRNRVVIEGYSPDTFPLDVPHSDEPFVPFVATVASFEVYLGIPTENLYRWRSRVMSFSVVFSPMS